MRYAYGYIGTLYQANLGRHCLICTTTTNCKLETVKHSKRIQIC
uniref:Uncharacterized protein n=1 Tax=Arundo donax TaxID=35708 RepID=A0A0A9E646_ARUDO